MGENEKNKLQEYTQKAGIPMPSYRTSSEGAPHAPQFRATVFVDGTHFTSPSTFPRIKQAEKDAARIAFHSILQKHKEEPNPSLFKPASAASPPHLDLSSPFETMRDTSMSKSIVVEYAVKMKLEKPTFVTKAAQGLTVYVSDLVLNGVNYTGQIAKSKKEAEQLAARAAIISIMNSESKLVMSEIIKSKKKLYALLHGAGVNQEAASDKVTDTSDLEMALNKRKEPAAPDDMTTLIPCNAGSGAIAQPFHEFKKPKVEPSSEVIRLPITFVPPGDISGIEFVACSPYGKNKNRKKKANQEIAGCDPQIADSVMPLSEVPPCSIGASVLELSS